MTTMDLKTVLTLAFVIGDIASAFIIQSGFGNATDLDMGTLPSGQTIQDLMTFLAEEKRLRFQLENRLDAAENRWNEYQAEVTKELRKDENNRQQLLNMFATGETELRNLTSDSKTNSQEIKKLDGMYASVSKEVTNIKNETTDLQTIITYLNKTVQNLTRNQEHSAQYQADIVEEIRKLKEESLIADRNISSLTERISNLTTENQNTITQLSNVQAHHSSLLWQLGDLKQQLANVSAAAKKHDARVGFSVNQPYRNTGNASNPLRFRTVVYNHDNDFNMSSGIFLCKRSGLYYFIHEISRWYGVDHVTCYIYKNGRPFAPFTYAYAGDADMEDYPSGSTSALSHLNQGDKVYVSRYDKPDKLGETTSFTGFLVNADE